MTSLNGCHNRPRPVAGKPLPVQDGYVYGMFEYESGASDRIPRMVTVPFVMKPECQYTLTTPDPRCAGCVHEKKDRDAEAA